MASHPERPDRAPEPDSPTARVEALSVEGTLLRGAAPLDPKALVIDPRRLIKVFVSYAHEDADLKKRLLDLLQKRLRTSRHYRFDFWDDRQIEPGKLWHDEGIQKAIADCDYGLLLVSWDFLTRDYILNDELPHFVSADPKKAKPAKRAIPVGLKKFLFRPHLDLKGLDKTQIFLLDQKRFFAEGRKQEEFVDALFEWTLAIVANDFPVGAAEETEPPPYKAVVELREERLEEAEKARRASTWFDRPPRPLVPIDPDKTLEGLARETSLQKGEGTSPATFGKPVEALAFLRTWATDPGQPPFCALLGEYGMGKTTACEMFTRRLIEDRKSDPRLPVPIFLDLRRLGDLAKQNPLLEDILRIVATRTYGEEAPPASEIKDLVGSGHAVAIFDGLDEVLVHLTETQGQSFTRELWRILPPRRLPAPGEESRETVPRGKLLISCRTHYFRTLRDERTHFLGEDREAIRAADYRALVLLPFTTGQILEYLRRTFPDQDAEKLLDMIRSIHNLEELAERPYTLKLIAEHIPKLEQWKLEGRKVTGVTLYREMVASWLERDAGKHTLTKDHKLRLMEHLATELWASGKRAWSAEDVEQWLMDFLDKYPRVRLHYEGEKRELLKVDLRTATFLVRDGEDGFRFAHTSLQEFFLAAHLHRSLREKRFEAWQIPVPSPETLDFLGQLIAEKDEKEALASFRELRGGYRSQASELMLAYALRAGEKGHPVPSLAGFRLDGARLKDWTIAAPEGAPRLDLQGASFRGANLHGARLHLIDVSDTDFGGADLTCAELIGGRGNGASFAESILVGAVFRDWSLSGADFESAKLHRTQWLRCTLRGVFGLDGATGGLFAGCDPEIRNLTRTSARLATLTGHGGYVQSCAFSPDDSRLASAGDDGSVRLWDAISGEVLQVLQGHRGWVSSCAFSPDGSRLASAGYDSFVRLWDAADGEALRVLEGHRGKVLSCAFSPDGSHLASTGEDSSVRLWDAADGNALRVFEGHRGRVSSCAFSPDGSQLATAGFEGFVRLWDVANGNALRVFKETRVVSCAFSPDGSRLATAGFEGSVRLWDAPSGKALRALKGHQNWVHSCAFSPNGSWLAAAGEHSPVRLWDTATGEALRVLSGHTGSSVSSCTFSSDGTRLASAGSDGSVRLWDVASGEALRVLKGHRDSMRSCAFSPDGTRLASTRDDGSVRLWDAVTGNALRIFEGHRDWVRSCAFSPDGTRLASAESNGNVRLWDAAKGETLRVLEGHRNWVSSCAFSPDSTRLASAGCDYSVRLWDANTGEALRVLKGHLDFALSCAFSPDGTRLASAGGDGSVRLWDAATGEASLVFKGHRSSVACCAFSPDGTRLASAGGDGSVRLWDAVTGEASQVLEGHLGRVWSCAFSPDGTRLASTGDDGSVRLWDAAKGEVRQVLEGHQGSVLYCAFSPDGARLASAGEDCSLRIWHVGSGREVGRIEYLPDGESASFFGPDLALSYASPGAWRWLGWLAPDPMTGVITRYPAEIFGPLPGPDEKGGFRER